MTVRLIDTFFKVILWRQSCAIIDPAMDAVYPERAKHAIFVFRHVSVFDKIWVAEEASRRVCETHRLGETMSC